MRSFMLFTILCIYLFSCVKSEDAIMYKRIDYIIATYQDELSEYSIKSTNLEKEFPLFENGGKNKYDLSININEQMAIQLAESIYSFMYPKDYITYLPFYAEDYKDLWIVYGHKGDFIKDIENWYKYGDYDEIIVVISKKNCEIFFYTVITPS